MAKNVNIPWIMMKVGERCVNDALVFPVPKLGSLLMRRKKHILYSCLFGLESRGNQMPKSRLRVLNYK